MSNSVSIRTVTADIACLSSGDYSDSFRVFMHKGSSGTWLPVILIISRGDLNPLHYANEVYEGLLGFGKEFGIKMDACTIYLDLTECLGIRVPHLFCWTLTRCSDRLESKVASVRKNDIKKSHADVLNSYYRDRWSIFTDSLLSNDEKAEIVASALADSVFDEFSIECVQLTLTHKLLDSLRTGNSFSWIV